jgi:hypothetical protein
MKLEKYTKQQEVMVKAGMTLCVECPNGYYGDKSCGACGMQRVDKKDTSGCFKPKSEENL